jgi:uncharacterized protein YkwD
MPSDARHLTAPTHSHSHAQRPRRRPELYAGARRRFSGFGTIVAGFVALVLVLGALLTSELGRYGEQNAGSEPFDNTNTPSNPPGALPPQIGTTARPTPTTAAPSLKSTPQPTPKSKPKTTGTTISDTVAAAVNKELDSLGCAPVTIDPKLVANAQSHMVQMINSGYYDVVSQGGTGPQGRARDAGYTGKVTESIVLGAETAVEATRIAFPLPVAANDALPVAVQVVAKSTLTCGWTHLGAEYRRDTRNVPVWSIVLGR